MMRDPGPRLTPPDPTAADPDSAAGRYWLTIKGWREHLWAAAIAPLAGRCASCGAAVAYLVGLPPSSGIRWLEADARSPHVCQPVDTARYEPRRSPALEQLRRLGVL
jgi:hypothetical protein